MTDEYDDGADVHETIPAFEGRPVHAVMAKMSGSAPLDDLVDTVLYVDDIVQTITLYRCAGISHQIDEKTGNLVRIQHLKPVEMELHPIDPHDPEDDGIVRALPQAVTGTVQDDE